MINIQEVSHNRSTVSSNGDSSADSYRATGQVQRGRGRRSGPWGRARGVPVRARIGSRLGDAGYVSEG
jgi:hypothetical protein